ncbi:hypothetical protein [Sphingomonas sp. GC_Shp_3]|nr:hypothetical protein [Sphingomonas sp. GC_Shp_3]
MMHFREKVAAAVRASDEPVYVSVLLWIGLAANAAMFWAACA